MALKNIAFRIHKYLKFNKFNTTEEKATKIKGTST